jgi:type III pantothenate kinase
MAGRLTFIAVDVGNTSTAVGLWTDARVSDVGHFDGGFRDASRHAAKLLARRGAASSPVALAYVSVVPAADSAWKAWAAKASLPLVEVSYRDAPMRLDYPDKAAIGADRLADATGAIARYGAPLIVMDFGTALTAAVVTADGVWRGGVIAPGFPLMRDYLFERTAKLPRMKLGSGVPPKIGKSTEGAMRFGAIVGYRGMVREIVSTLERNFGDGFRLVATGGFAKWALKDAGMDFTIDPDLTLFGAGCIAARSAAVRDSGRRKK